MGRADERVELARLLETTGVVTVVGPGGVGKTRLAVQVAHDVMGNFEHGAWLVDLVQMGLSNRLNRDIVAVLADLTGLEPTGQTFADFGRYGTLVETEGIEASYLYSDGTPQSRSISLVERFDIAAGEQRLNYRISISDPESFTETLEFSRYWVWQPDIRIQPYSCGNLQ